MFFVSVQCGLTRVGNYNLCAHHLGCQQCRGCGRRLEEHLFTDDSSGRICNACHRSRVGWMQTGRGFPRRSSVNGTFITEEIPIPETVSDPLAYIAREKETLAQSLRNAL